MAADPKPAWGKSGTEAPILDAPAPPAPKPAAARSIDSDRAELAKFGLILLAAGLAMVHPSLALIAPGLYLLVVTYPRRR